VADLPGAQAPASADQRYPLFNQSAKVTSLISLSVGRPRRTFSKGDSRSEIMPSWCAVRRMAELSRFSRINSRIGDIFLVALPIV
jgi:hypothetical protein